MSGESEGDLLLDAKMIVKNLARSEWVDPDEVWAVRDNDHLWFWIASYEVTDDKLDMVLADIEPGKEYGIVLQFFRETLVRKWLISGSNETHSEVYLVVGDEHLAQIVGMVTTYFANGTEEGDATN